MAPVAEEIFIDPSFYDEYTRHPLILADVGARGGLKRNWLPAQKHLRVFAFEPDRKEFDRLVDREKGQSTSHIHFNAALHNRRGPLALNITQDRGLSSIFEPNQAFISAFPDASRFNITAVANVDADTLDNLLMTCGLTDLDFIKADTQGSELYVLEGAAQLLESSVVGVEVEVEFTPVYANQPLFADVDAYLRSLGFFLFDLRPCYWKRTTGRDVGGAYGQIIWSDALYLKSIPALQAALARFPEDRRRSKILRAISIAVLYGYYDYALEINRSTVDVLTADERSLIERRLRERGARRDVPTFPGRRLVAGALRRLWRTFRLPNDGWSISDAGIGNVD